MSGNDGGNAMTEIALALAMAFFAIMILTMVSMSAGNSSSKSAGTQKDIVIRALPARRGRHILITITTIQ